ncbi:putative disease resistance protein At3g14460 [Arachis stenosperma]|uniref:putative disease resistance protein At3g14460 n=1 Tax=Arachis stenosperma TaxID=217475 RepID=UPI0025AC0D21|nr:putative disease resistance protein At3g14460 [Arachis stenosperma]
MMGRALLSSFLSDLVDNIKRIITSQTKASTVTPLQMVMSTLLALDAVVDSAEEKQFRGGRSAQVVKKWLNKVQDALYQVDELLLQILTPISSTPDLHPLPKDFMEQILDTLPNLESLVQQIDILDLTFEPAMKRWMKSSGGLYSTSAVLDKYPEYDFFVRNAEVESILDYLLSTSTENEQHIKMINIVGLAGVGKTALANVLFSNHKVTDSFEIIAKIFVSNTATSLMVKDILQPGFGNFYGDHDLHKLCEILESRCRGKKCLLVLDDIIIEDRLQDWRKLIASFETGAAEGSAIIHTSIPHRDPMLFKFMVHEIHTVHLDLLSIEDWLSIFMGHASRQRNNVGELPKELSAVGEKIVNKLGALPLAAKMTGSLLQDKLDLNPGWDKILSEFLDDVNLLSIALDTADGDANLPIPSFLVLCYLDLPAPVKRCFAYLSLFPKSYHFRKEELICQWMAHGFLKYNESGKSMEDVGDEYFGYLIKRSFLQPAFGYHDTFMMHDHVHYLAIYVSGESYKHHLCYDGRIKDFALESIPKHGRSLRTIMPVHLGFERERSEFDPNLWERVITKLSKHVFQALSLSHYKITSLPASIGGLTHLCYLNVSYTDLKEIPDSICDLLNLQTLLLIGCRSLTSLPDRLCNLVKLRRLDFHGSSLRRMPPDIHNLTSLRVLTHFIVSETGPRLGHLAGLSNLKRLDISSLQNVGHFKDASDAKLREKKGLADLRLSWDHYLRRKGNEMEVLENLEPHQDLKFLVVDSYRGSTFPKWLGDPSYSSLQNLYLYDCENCESLPTLGLLPTLRELAIGGFTKVSSVGPEFYGEMTASQKPFQSLKVLRFMHMPEWKEWNIGIEFPHLVNLCIIRCPKLVGDLPKELPSLNKLEIIECTRLVAPCLIVSNTCEVILHKSHVTVIRNSHLDTDTVSQITLKPNNSGFRGRSILNRSLLGFSSDTASSPEPKETSAVMQSHHVEAKPDSKSSMAKADIPITTQATVIPSTTAPFKAETLSNEEAGEVLKVSTISQLKSLPPTLHTLKIEGCESLEAIPNDLLAGLTALKELYVINCGSLTSLPSLGSVTALYIRNCRRLQNLSSSESGKQLAFLHHLSIGSNCDSLATLPLNLFWQLKTLCIWDCPNLQSFHLSGEARYDLTSLESLEIRDCPRLKSFPEKGLHAPSLVSLLLSNCESLEKLPNAMDSLVSLKSLFLHRCPRVESFPPGGLSSSLVFLSIASCEKLWPRKDWGLHNLKYLSRFELEGGCIGMESFPEENLLPFNLDSLSLSTLKHLKKLDNKGFQHLNCLRSLEIHCCEMLQSLFDEGFPSSLEHLCVQECSLLTPKLKSMSGAELHKMAHIQHIQIDGQILY